MSFVAVVVAMYYHHYYIRAFVRVQQQRKNHNTHTTVLTLNLQLAWRCVLECVAIVSVRNLK